MYRVMTDTIDTYHFRTRDEALAFVLEYRSIHPYSELDILDASYN